MKLLLSRALAQVLELLGREGQDWWLINDLAGELKISSHALQQRISLLRKALVAQFSNPCLIETEGDRAYARVRLAPRQHAAGSAPAITDAP